MPARIGSARNIWISGIRWRGWRSTAPHEGGWGRSAASGVGGGVGRGCPKQWMRTISLENDALSSKIHIEYIINLLKISSYRVLEPHTLGRPVQRSELV